MAELNFRTWTGKEFVIEKESNGDILGTIRDSKFFPEPNRCFSIAQLSEIHKQMVSLTKTETLKDVAESVSKASQIRQGILDSLDSLDKMKEFKE